MHKINPKNERIKRRYFEFMREADRKAEATIRAAEKAINRYEGWAGFADFGCFSAERAKAFKATISKQKTARGNAPLSKSSIQSTIHAIQRFFKWLAYQPGYKSRIKVTDIEYLNLSEKDLREAKTSVYRPFPTIEQIELAVNAMPHETVIQRRDRALIAFTILTGMRDRAIASLKLKHIDVHRKLVHQDSREVKTKASKTIETSFFQIGKHFERIVLDWFRELREVLGFGNDDPVFPATQVAPNDDMTFAAIGLDKRCWSSADRIRKVFRSAFEAVGLSYYPPHSFRKTLVQLGEQRCQTPEEFKAWSQNLGHEHVLTTFTSYGQVSIHRQIELVQSVGQREEEASKVDEILSILKSGKA